MTLSDRTWRRTGESAARPLLLVLVAAVCCVSALPVGATARVYTEKRTRYEIHVRPLTAEAAPDTDPSRLEIVLDGRSDPGTDIPLSWPDDGSVSRLHLAARTVTPVEGEATHALVVDAELRLPTGDTVHASRRITFDSDDTVLFEVYRVGDRPLTLLLDVSADQETVFSRHPTVGAPLRFIVEVQRVLDGRAISLESNELRTMVGQSVSYAFKLGADDQTQSAEIRLNPVRLDGDLVEIEVDINGRLPDAGAPRIVSRHERVFASRGAASTVALESGDPPSGYRFVVTAEY